MPGIDIRLNTKNYILRPREDGSKILTRPVQQFVNSVKDTGRTRPEDVSPYETFIHPDLTGGFGRHRINSDKAFDPNEYKRFWDSTLDTRWQDAVYLPILAENSTQSGLNVVKCSASYKGELHSLWSQTLGSDAGGSAATNRGAVNRLFTGASTDAWENGGYLSQPATVTSMAAGADETEYAAVVNVQANTDLLVVVVTYTDASNIGNAITGMAYNAASNGSGGTAMDAAFNSYNADTGVGIFYKVNPTASSGSNNYFFCRLNSVSGTTVDEISAVAYHIRGVNTGTLSLATANSVDSSGTTISNAVSTAAGDFVVDGFAGDDNIAASSSGTGQQSGMAATGTSINRSHKSSYRIATGTTTTMSHTLASSISGDFISAAAAFAMDPVTPVDITTSTVGLVAMVVQGDDHRTYTSADGATWSEASTPISKGYLASEQAADFGTTDPFDAGLLGNIGGETVAATWYEDSGGVQFYSSTNGGSVWASEIFIRSNNGPQGLATYPGIDSEDKLYLATHEGIYEIDTSPSTWTYQLIFTMSGSNHNGRRMTVHSGSLWFAQGVDNDSPAPIYRMTVSGSSRLIQSGYGLDVGDGVPDDMLGPVRYMKSTGDQLFISVGGGASSRKARILSWNGTGWHHMYRNATANQKIDWLDVGSGDDGVPRLHFSMRTGTSTCDAEFLEQPLVNPRSGVSIKREDDVSSGGIFTTGYVDLPYIDLGMPHENKNFLRTHVNGEDLNSSASDEYINIQYGINDAVRTNVSLGDYTSATTVNTFASNAGVSGKNIGMRVNFLRGSTNTASPKLKDLIVEGMIVPGNGNLSYQHEITIDIDQSATATGLSTESVYSNLKTLLATVTQVDFEFGAESRKVTVDRDNSAFLTYLDEAGYASAPNSMATRRGILRLVLVERIPLT